MLSREIFRTFQAFKILQVHIFGQFLCYTLLIEQNVAKEFFIMKHVYITLTGTRHYFGSEFLEAKMPLTLRKEPENEHDREAIRVELEGLGCIGYVANSPYSVLGESYSAGRLYDKIGDTASASIKYVLPNGVLCEVTLETEGDE